MGSRRALPSTKTSPRLAGSVSVIRFMLGEHLEHSLADMAEKHRLHLMARERPEEFAVMERAVMLDAQEKTLARDRETWAFSNIFGDRYYY